MTLEINKNDLTSRLSSIEDRRRVTLNPEDARPRKLKNKIQVQHDKKSPTKQKTKSVMIVPSPVKNSKASLKTS